MHLNADCCFAAKPLNQVMKNKTSKTDKELVLLLIHNNEKAFRELYIRYKGKLWHYCFSFLKSEEESDDLIQEIFICLWELRGSLNPELSFSSFMYSLVRNRVLNYFRDMDVETQAKKALSGSLLTKTEHVETDIIYTEYQQILKDAIDHLPPQRKKVFIMSRTDNMSHKEIATHLGLSVNTVQDHISESMRFIKTYFSQYADLA